MERGELSGWEKKFLLIKWKWFHQDPPGFALPVFPWGKRQICMRKSWGREVGSPWEFHW